MLGGGDEPWSPGLGGGDVDVCALFTCARGSEHPISCVRAKAKRTQAVAGDSGSRHDTLARTGHCVGPASGGLDATVGATAGCSGCREGLMMGIDAIGSFVAPRR